MNPLRREHRFSKYIRALALVSATLTMCGITVIANDVKPDFDNIQVHASDKPDDTNIPISPSRNPDRKTDVPATIETLPNPDANINCEELYILVSTIDGKVTALNLHDHGSLMWEVQADTRPLYSSSLANLEIIRNGKKLRVIPSLDGALYQYDGEKVEAVPMSAETLLSNTFRLSDDAMVVGSKDIRNYGIDVKTGQIQYTCGSEGCKTNMGQAEASWNNVVVVTRTTQVVRSVEIKNGVEKWNFSVGQHQLSLPPQKQAPQIDADDSDEDSDEYVAGQDEEDWPWITRMNREKCATKFPEDMDIENYLRLIVPEGKVIALSKEGGASGVRWEHKFESPIAKAWLLREGKVVPMNLFDGRHLPTLGTAFEPEDLENESMHQPLLYIGSHQKHLYIQPSPKMESMLKKFPSQRIGHVFDSNVKVSWRPYLNTASFRTPIFGGNRPAITEEPEPKKPEKTNALAVWHEDYPFDTGYFLYPDFLDGSSRVKQWPSFSSPRRPRLESLDDTFWVNLRYTIGYIALVVAGLVSLYFTLFQTTSSPVSETKSNSKDSASNTSSPDSNPVSDDCTETKEMYTSRFATDFECLQCLGKGGFGIVFEAVHRFDNNHYAVKRTILPDREEAREKVLREAKCLAKLEHRGITRYFSAWVESPPSGWQEEEDKKHLANEASETSFSVQSYSTNVDHLKVKRNIAHKPLFNKPPILPNQGKEAFLYTDSSLSESGNTGNSLIKPRSNSEEFTVHSWTGNTDSYGGYGFDSTTDACSLQLTTLSASQTSEGTNSQPNIPIFRTTSPSSKLPHNFICASDKTDDSIVFEESNNPVAHFSSNNAFEYSNVTDDSVVFEESNNPVAHFTSNNAYDEYSNVTNDSIVFEETNNPVAHFTGNNSNALGYSVSNDSIVFEESNAEVHKKTNRDFCNNRCRALPQTNNAGRVDKIHAQGCPEHHTVDISVSRREEESVRQHDTEIKHFLYIQMQLYRKDTLKDWLNNTPHRDHETVVNIFLQLVEAVDYLHNQRLMHRDLKPSNIFFSDDGVVKIGDFGLVTSLSVEQDEGNQNTSSKHTAEVGTTLYMSPEQISRQPYDFKVDIFSLGLIFLELCVPFSTQMERIRSILDVKRQVFPSKFITDCPVEFDLVKQMTSTVSARRPTARDILDHELLKDFEPTGVEHRRTRSRTISNDSNSNS